MRIKIHYSLIILIIFAAYTGFMKSILIIYGLILLHEAGHLVSCFYFKKQITMLTLIPMGGIIDYPQDDNDFLYKEVIIVLSGIAVNIIMHFILTFFQVNQEIIHFNLYILFFNSLPIYPLDGGRMVELIFAHFFKLKNAINYILLFSIFEIILLSIFGFFYLKSISLLLIISLLLMQNMLAYKTKNLRYEAFLLKKHLYPNKYLKNKRHIRLSTSLIKSFYKGKNNVFIGKREVEEQEILNNYFDKLPLN